ncbi:MAG: glutaredoxin family protein [Rhodocyclales bacterium]|nr:glutaredoxin family protein [Rhodocyclales bacterium]
MSRFASAVALLLLAAPALGDMYKIVGADGKVSYADAPPADQKSAKVAAFKVKSYAGAAVVGSLKAQPDWAAILRRPIDVAVPRAGIVMFSTETCGFCKKAKRYMDAKGLSYSEIDVDKDARGHEEYRRLGGNGVPFFVVAGKTMTGFSESAFEKLLKGSGR